MKRLTFQLFIFVLLASLVLAACGGGQKSVVRVATDATWPPFEYVDDTSKDIVGFDIDLMKAA
jgi:ABC-type amino acid transport substrate-binding protein